MYIITSPLHHHNVQNPWPMSHIFASLLLPLFSTTALLPWNAYFYVRYSFCYRYVALFICLLFLLLCLGAPWKQRLYLHFHRFCIDLPLMEILNVANCRAKKPPSRVPILTLACPHSSPLPSHATSRYLYAQLPPAIVTSVAAPKARCLLHWCLAGQGWHPALCRAGSQRRLIMM